MKRLLIITFYGFLTTSALASEEFYIRGNIGAFWNTNQKLGDSNNTLKFKSKVAPLIDIGFGYNIADDFRAELVYTHLLNPQSKTSKSWTTNTGIVNNRSINITYKGRVDAILLNSYFDVIDFDAGKLFLGGGLGISRVREKVTAFSTKNGVAKREPGTTFKGKNNFAYNLMVGSSFNLSDGINLDIQYKWADYGTTKYDKTYPSSKLHRRGNAVQFGIRLDI